MPPEINAIHLNTWSLDAFLSAEDVSGPGDISTAEAKKAEGAPKPQAGSDVGSADAKLEGWQMISKGTFVGDKKFVGKNLLKEMKPGAPKGYDVNFETPAGARDAMFSACRGFKEKFVDKSGIEAKLDACRKALAKMPDGAEKDRLKKELDGLVAQGKSVVHQREQITRFLPTEPRKVYNQNATPKDIATLANRDMKDAYVALRNLSYDLKSAHGSYSKGQKFKHDITQTFTTTRNALFRGIQNAIARHKLAHPGKKGLGEIGMLKTVQDQCQKVGSFEIKGAEESYDAFLAGLNKFALAVKDPSCGVPGPQVGEELQSRGRQAMDEAIADVQLLKDGLRARTGGSAGYTYSAEENLTKMFAGMTKGSSSKFFVLKLEAGVAVPVPVANLSASAKYEYAFRVHCNDAGQVMIERCHSGGVNAKAGVGIDDIAEVSAEAGFTAGKGTGESFMSPADAAKALASGKMGPLHQFFLDGTMSGVKSACKLIKQVATKKPSYSDMRFVAQARQRGIMPKELSYNFKGLNAAYLADTSFVRLSGGAAVRAKVDAIISANAEACLDIEKDVKAEKTVHRSYYAYFTADRIGEAGSVYASIAEHDSPFDDVDRTNALLKREPTTPEEKRQLAQDILDELKAMAQRESDFTVLLAGTDPKDLPSASTVCAACRQATVALVALQDKLASLKLPPDPARDGEMTKVADSLRDNFQRPRGLAMTKGELLEGLYVDRSYDDRSTTFKVHIGASIDMATGLFDQLRELTDSKLANAAINVANTAMNRLATMPSAEADVTVVVPGQGEKADRRPFRSQTRTTIGITFKGDLTGKAIVALIQDKFRAAAKKTGLPLDKQGFDAKGILMSFLPQTLKAGVSGLTAGDAAGMSDEQAEATLLKVVSGSSKTQTKFVSFELEDGRLTAVGIGSGSSKSSVKGVIAGPVKASESTARASKTVSDTIYATPSFDALTAKGDDFRVMGHGTEWTQFSMEHQGAFLRMAEIAAGKVPAGDKNAADDAKRIDTAIDRMMDDIQTCKRPQQRAHLLANFNRFAAAQRQLRDLYNLPPAQRAGKEQMIVEQMRMMLEAAADHYNILESVGGYGGALAIDQLKNLQVVEPPASSSGGDLASDFVSMNWV